MNKEKLLALLDSFNSHSVYYIEPIAEKLAECDLAVEVAPDKKSMTIGGVRVDVSVPEWGEPGVSPLSILGAVYELATGSRPQSNMSGMGFWYRHVLEQLTRHWKEHDEI